ncbi:hypothetical protein ACHQM5_030223 [Ranunculus cassubicifolius]
MQDEGISRDFPPRIVQRFKGIIWPGESTNVSKGWVIPMDKKLKIGVPVHGFKELVNVERDPFTNATMPEGFIIDVFNAAIQLLEYTIPFEYVPFPIEDGNSERSYTKLIDKVYFQKYDAVVGDVTITANRSLYVDFSFPFTEGGVWMIVPLRQPEESTDKWMLHPSHVQNFIYIFLGIFIIISLIVSFLERGLQGDSISTEKRKKIISYLLWFMVIVWILLNIALTITCVVALSPVFTRDQRDATVTDFNDLRVKGSYVGYRRGSHISDILKRSQFDESKLKSYSSPEECHELLTKGSENGGVAAVFDEKPNIEIFLSKYCSLYTKVGPTHKTDGYGFVFPLGSPLVSDVSNAILEITEGHKLNDILSAWFPPNKTCPEEGWAISSSRNRVNPLWIIVCVVAYSYTITSCMCKKKQS